MEIVFTDDELRRCLPPAGRYRVAVDAVAASSDDPRPAQVRITWGVLDRPDRPSIYDCFVLRGALSLALPGLRRFLGLLRLAGIAVQPGCPVDVDALVGLECLIDVERGFDPAGFPYSRIVRYQPVIAATSAPRATDPRSSNTAAARAASGDGPEPPLSA
jgi:hypothetical protein